MQSKEAFTGIRQGLLNYARALGKNNSVFFVWVYIKEVVTDMMLSYFTARNAGATDIHYTRLYEMMMMHESKFMPPICLAKDDAVVLSLHMKTFDDPCLHISSKETIFLMNVATKTCRK